MEARNGYEANNYASSSHQQVNYPSPWKESAAIKNNNQMNQKRSYADVIKENQNKKKPQGTLL